MNKIFKFCIVLGSLFLLSSCNKKNYVDDETHNFGAWIEEVEPTCESDGLEGHYHCSDCNKDFDQFFNEIPGGAQPIKGGHKLVHIGAKEATGYKEGNIDCYICQTCQKYFTDKTCNEEVASEDFVIPCKVMSIKDIKEAGVYDEVGTVRAVVIGATGNTDGGHIWYILKDFDSNEQILLRSYKEQDFSADEDTLSCTKGYSYAPSMLFQVGDIVEVPVKFANSGGTSNSGGEYEKDMLLWQGEDFTKANAKEEAGEWFKRYVVGHSDDIAIDHNEVTRFVRSQEDLNALFSSNGFQNETICFEGTNEKPLKFVTGCKDGIEDINREYLYIFYNDAKSLNDCKVGKANPVFSNFGNTFNMYSPLSTLLVDQREYEAVNFDKPYEFVGKIYATCVGGNSSYYHLVCMSEDDIINTNNTGSHAIISAKMAKNVFYKYMEEKLASMNVNIGTPIFTAIGTSYVVSPEDLCKILLLAYKTPAIQEFYGAYEQQVTITKKNGTVNTPTVLNGPLNNEDYKKYITSKYEPIGTKGGSLAGVTEERPYEVMNNISIVKGPDGTVMVACVCMHRADSADKSETPYYNCYLEMGKVFDIMVKKHNGMSTKDLEDSLLCYSCAGIMIPANGDLALDYDYFSSSSDYIHFSTDNADKKIVSASIWKMFTSTCFLSIVPEEDLDTVATFGSTEENSMVNKAPDLVGGDKLSYRDALYITLLPSSNDTPTFLARCGGEYLIRAMFPNG